MSHAVAYSIVFILFCEQGWDGGVFKVMKKDHFVVFLAVWVVFPKFVGRLRGTYVKAEENKISVTCSCVPNCF